LYDQQGKCVEQPFEPQQSMLKHTIRHPAYPVQKLGGLLWTYMGPREKQPLLPRWDILVREDGTRSVSIAPVLRCNWLQAEENTADSTHAHFLHHNYDAFLTGLKPTIDLQQETPLERYGFQRFRWGITKSLFYGGDNPHVLYERPLIFPNMLRLADSIHWRVPINDVTTQIFEVSFRASPDGKIVEQPENPPFRRAEPWVDETGEYHMKTTPAQDGMAWETQGPVFDRTKEHLGSSDAGIVMLRQLLAEQIKLVSEGGDPIALVTDPAENKMIDMWSHSLGIQGGRTEAGRERWAPRGVPFDQLFDETHVLFEVPIGAARPAPQ
jgi:5,5'-dehydrodivanillate O-demethylase